MTNKLMSEIPKSYFGSVSGLPVESGPLPLLNMAVGIPDGAAPKEVVHGVKSGIDELINQQYTAFRGRESFKKAIKDFYYRHYRVTLNDENIAIVYGTKNGLTILPSAYIEPGDIVYLPNPGYPDYYGGVKLARGKVVDLPLIPENNYLPDFAALNQEELSQAKLIYLNYPSNPLGVVASKSFFDETIERFRHTNTKIIHDFAYAAFGFQENHPSILQSDPYFEVSAEFYSLSKSYNMSGFRVGFLVGNKDIIHAVNTIQDHTQTGMWGLTQDAATIALNEADEFLKMQNNTFFKRKQFLEKELQRLNIPFNPVNGGIFVWLRTPDNYTTNEFLEYMLKEHSILITPGYPFGSLAEKYFRISMARPLSELETFIERMETIKHLWYKPLN